VSKSVEIGVEVVVEVLSEVIELGRTLGPKLEVIYFNRML